MALTRKPRIGEILTTDNGANWRVDRFITEDICAISDPRKPVPSPGDPGNSFIWRFHDGLNTWFNHEPEN